MEEGSDVSDVGQLVVVWLCSGVEAPIVPAGAKRAVLRYDVKDDSQGLDDFWQMPRRSSSVKICFAAASLSGARRRNLENNGGLMVVNYMLCWKSWLLSESDLKTSG